MFCSLFRLLLRPLNPSVCLAHCAHRCNRWTCNNVNFCGACDASICEGANPHHMCSDPAQRYCGAPRCETWCPQEGVECERVECSGCASCSASGEARPAPSPFPAPDEIEASLSIRRAAEVPTCDQEYLGSLKTELRSLVDAQRARNHDLRVELGQVTSSLPPAVPSTPPLPPSLPPSAAPSPPPCVPVGAQCGGTTWTGTTSCCQGASPGDAPRVCRQFHAAFSGCREVDV